MGTSAQLGEGKDTCSDQKFKKLLDRNLSVDGWISGATGGECGNKSDSWIGGATEGEWMFGRTVKRTERKAIGYPQIWTEGSPPATITAVERRAEASRLSCTAGHAAFLTGSCLVDEEWQRQQDLRWRSVLFFLPSVSMAARCSQDLWREADGPWRPLSFHRRWPTRLASRFRPPHYLCYTLVPSLYVLCSFTY